MAKKKARSYKKMLGQATRRSRLRAAALEGESGRFWYQQAEREIRRVARAWGVKPSAVAAAVAATSPATPVISSPRMTRGGGSGSNIGKARRVVKAWSRNKPASSIMNVKSPGFTRLQAYEDAIEAGASAEGAIDIAFPKPDTVKTHAFVRNLLGDPNAVTVDTLIARGAGIPMGPSGARVTPKRYKLVANDIRAVAKRLKWQPREVMAAAWTGWGGTGGLTLARKAEARKHAHINPRSVWVVSVWHEDAGGALRKLAAAHGGTGRVRRSSSWEPTESEFSFSSSRSAAAFARGAAKRSRTSVNAPFHMRRNSRKRKNPTGPCGKCDGKGYIRAFSHIEGGRCFWCGGSGTLTFKAERKQAKRAPAKPRNEKSITIKGFGNVVIQRTSHGNLRAGVDMFDAYDGYVGRGWAYFAVRRGRVHVDTGRLPNGLRGRGAALERGLQKALKTR